MPKNEFVPRIKARGAPNDDNPAKAKFSQDILLEALALEWKELPEPVLARMAQLLDERAGQIPVD